MNGSSSMTSTRKAGETVLAGFCLSSASMESLLTRRWPPSVFHAVSTPESTHWITVLTDTPKATAAARVEQKASSVSWPIDLEF